MSIVVLQQAPPLDLLDANGRLAHRILPGIPTTLDDAGVALLVRTGRSYALYLGRTAKPRPLVQPELPMAQPPARKSRKKSVKNDGE